MPLYPDVSNYEDEDTQFYSIRVFLDMSPFQSDSIATSYDKCSNFCGHGQSPCCNFRWVNLIGIYRTNPVSTQHFIIWLFIKKFNECPEVIHLMLIFRNLAIWCQSSGVWPVPVQWAVRPCGLSQGRIVEIFDPEASGKTTLALHVIAEAQ